MKSRKKLETRFPKNSFKKIIGLIAFGSCLLGCATDTRQTSDLRNLQIKSNLNLNEDSAKVAELKRFQNNQILWEPKSEMSYTIAELLQDPVPDPYYLMALGEKNLKLVKNIARIYSSPKDNRPMFFDNPKDGAASSKRKKLEAPLAPPWSFVSLNNVSNLAYCDFGSAWTNVSHEFTTLLARRFKQLIGPLPLIPTTLKQDPYESRFNFQRRVASVAKKYNEEIREYNRRAQSYSISNSDQTRLLQGAFQSLFGNPIIKNTTYDPDHGTFTVELISDSPFAIDFKQFSVLDQKIPNISAKDFNSRIMESTPVILFQREGLDLAILKEGFIIDGKLYSAKPIAPQENPVELASANLRNLDTAFLSSPKY